MPAFDKVIQEKPALVLEFGAALTKIGFAGDPAPRNILRSEIITVEGEHVPVFTDDATADELYDKLRSFLQTIFLKYLLVNCKERRIVVFEDMYGHVMIRETLARLLFVHFDVPMLVFLPTHTIALTAVGRSTGLVVDIGHNETSILPVCHGMPIVRAYKDLGVAGRAAITELKRLLVESGISATLLTPAVLEDMLVRTCFFTSLKRANELRNGSLAKPASDVEYIFCDQGTITVPGRVRETVLEIFFEDNNERDSLPHLMLQSILDCDIDARLPLIANIFIIGGMASYDTLLQRLQDELKDLLNKYYKDKFFGEPSFKFIGCLGCPNFAAWLGGSIYGATDMINQQSITKDSYLRRGSMPDWTSAYSKRLDS